MPRDRPDPRVPFMCEGHRRQRDADNNREAYQQEAYRRQLEAYQREIYQRERQNPTPAQPLAPEPVPCDVPSCESLAEGDSIYCSRHFGWVPCSDRDCDAQAQSVRDAPRPLCLAHTCEKPRCPMFKNADAHGCHVHECEVENCQALKHRGNYCRLHVCVDPDCPNIVGPVGDLCTKHRCKKSSCERPAKFAGGFCQKLGHGCSEPTCAKEALNQGDTPHLCWGHVKALQEEAKEAARAEGIAQGAEQGAAEVEKRFEEYRAEVNSSRNSASPGPSASSPTSSRHHRDSRDFFRFSSSPDSRGNLRPPSRERQGRREKDYYPSSGSSDPRSDGSGSWVYTTAPGSGGSSRRQSQQYYQSDNQHGTFAQPIYQQHGYDEQPRRPPSINIPNHRDFGQRPGHAGEPRRNPPMPEMRGAHPGYASPQDQYFPGDGFSSVPRSQPQPDPRYPYAGDY